MKQALGWLRLETYKLLHSSMLLVHLVLPLLCMAGMLAYYAVSPWSVAQKVSLYLQLLAMAFPVVIAVITAMAAEREAQAGNFQVLLAAPCKTFLPHTAAIMVLLVFGFLAVMGAVCGFGLLFGLMGHMEFPVIFYLKAAGLLFLGNIPVYLLQYLAAFLWGRGASIGLGIIGSLLCALLITGLGDGIWPCIPWGTGIHFVSALAAHPYRMFAALPEMKSALCFIAAESSILILIMVYWSQKWEGRKSEAE